jgi:hypothetical protein
MECVLERLAFLLHPRMELTELCSFVASLLEIGSTAKESPKTVTMSPFQMSRLATTPQLSVSTSIPRTCDTRSSACLGMLLSQVQSFTQTKSMRFFHSHAMTGSLFTNR